MEIEIAEMFVKYQKYFPYFSSCNIVQRKNNTNLELRWCNNCPKCLFTYLILAPHIGKSSIRKIFNKDLLDEQNMEQFLRDLIGLGKHKPFECVGQYEECRESLKKLSLIDEYKTDYLVANYTVT